MTQVEGLWLAIGIMVGLMPGLMEGLWKAYGRLMDSLALHICLSDALEGSGLNERTLPLVNVWLRYETLSTVIYVTLWQLVVL